MCLCNVYVYVIRKLAYAEQSWHGSVAFRCTLSPLPTDATFKSESELSLKIKVEKTLWNCDPLPYNIALSQHIHTLE